MGHNISQDNIFITTNNFGILERPWIYSEDS